MLKRKIRNLAIAGATVVSLAVPTTLAATGASATTMSATDAGHLSVPANTARSPVRALNITGFEINNYDNLCLGIQGGREDAPAVQWTCQFPAPANQLWHWGSSNGAGWLQIRNGSNQCLGVAGESKQLGALVYAWTCNGHPDQYWLGGLVNDPGSLPGSYVVFQNYNSRLYLSVDGCNATRGALINQWGFVNRTCQFWSWPHVLG